MIEKSREMPEPVDVIHIGQEFQLFAPHRTTPDGLPKPNTDPIYQVVPGFMTEISLMTGVPPHLPIAISAHSGDAQSKKREIITPFDPAFGHTLSGRDFDPAKRREDIILLQDQIDYDKVPLNILISCIDEDWLLESGLWSSDSTLTPKAQRLFERLAVQLYFPTMSLESRTGEFSLADGKLLFHLFYPLDTGPLPQEPDGKDPTGKVRGRLADGLSIRVPQDPDLLAQITAKFVLYPPSF